MIFKTIDGKIIKLKNEIIVNGRGCRCKGTKEKLSTIKIDCIHFGQCPTPKVVIDLYQMSYFGSWYEALTSSDNIAEHGWSCVSETWTPLGYGLFDIQTPYIKDGKQE